MPTITYTDAAGNSVEVGGNVGDSVMETAVRNGVPGFVDEADFAGLPPMEEMEDEMLWGTSVDRGDTSRLCCQIKIVEGMDLHVTTPETQV